MVYMKCLHNVLGFSGLFEFFFFGGWFVLFCFFFFPSILPPPRPPAPDNNIPLSGEFSTVISQTLTRALYIPPTWVVSEASGWQRCKSVSDIPRLMFLSAFLSKKFSLLLLPNRGTSLNIFISLVKGKSHERKALHAIQLGSKEGSD